jgi:hypothetical protein
MTVRSNLPVVMLAAVLAGCGGSQAPVPVVGREADVSQLAGEWYGEYSSVESGRSGSIVFKLVAGADSAMGDVVMTPQWVTRQGNMPMQPGATAQPTSQPLSIRFVRVSGGQVSGALDPYTDPNCGCTLHTTFVGRLRADTLEGTYTSLHEQTRDVQKGRWRVVRKPS